jgi:hypothetical protein
MWLRKWKKDFWMKPLFSQMSQLSLGSNSLHTWLEGFCLSDNRASQSQWQENEKPQKTSDGCLTLSQMEFPLCDQECSSQKMLKDSSQQKCQTDQASSDTASRDWSVYIIKLRQEYSARLKSALPTSASGSSSWPTIRASEYKDTGPIGSKSHDHMLGKGYLCAAVTQDAANWPTIQARDYRSVTGNEMSQRDNAMQNLNIAVTMHGLPAPASSSSLGSRLESWRTPSSSDGEGGVMEMREGCAGKYKLRDHVVAEQKSWATATVSTGAHRQKDGSMTPKLDQQVSGKLNPRWVETLMGLPVGWVMPSCASPVTIEQTNFDSSATESCLPQPSELFAF